MRSMSHNTILYWCSLWMPICNLWQQYLIKVNFCTHSTSLLSKTMEDKKEVQVLLSVVIYPKINNKSPTCKCKELRNIQLFIYFFQLNTSLSVCVALFLWVLENVWKDSHHSFHLPSTLNPIILYRYTFVNSFLQVDP